MSVSRSRWGELWLGVAGAVLVLNGAAGSLAASDGPAGASLGLSAARIRVPDMATAWPLRQAINGAHEWLEEPACRKLFSDFENQSGQRLSAVLAEREVTGQEHLGRLTFYDGSPYPQCNVKGIAAVTVPGNYVIYVCPNEFRRVSRDSRKATAVIVHELLHSLGLGENPPSSREITKRVMQRCGS